MSLFAWVKGFLMTFLNTFAPTLKVIAESAMGIALASALAMICWKLRVGEFMMSARLICEAPVMVSAWLPRPSPTSTVLV